MKNEKDLSRREINALWKITQKNIYGFEGRKAFERRWNDEEDFPEVSIWGLEGAMKEAYRLGLKNGEKRAKENTKA